MRIKLHWKFTIIFCAAALIGFSAGYVYQTGRLRTYVEKNIENNLKRQLLICRDLLEARSSAAGGVLLFDPDALAHETGKELGVRVTIISKEGTVLGDTDMDRDHLKKMDNHILRDEVQEALKKGFGMSKRYSFSVRKNFLYMATPFGRRGMPAGFVRLSVPLSDIELLEAHMQKMILFSLLLAFSLSLVFSYLISFFVSRPLSEMATIARAMAEGDFSKKPLVGSKDEVGNLAEALGYMSDQIRQKIETIQQEGAKLDTVLSSMLEGILVVDSKGTILLINPSLRKQFFIDTETEGKMPMEVFRNAAVQKIIDRILEKTGVLISEEIVTSRPEEKVLKVNGVPITRDGKIQGAVLVFHDITELRRLEKMRQDFVANASHELRTPIASIKGYAETLLEGAIEDKSHARDFVRIIHEDSNRLAVLTDDLLDLSKIESGKMEMRFEPSELKSIAQRALGVLDKQAKGKSLQIALQIPEDLPKILVDGDRLSQVFLNLLDNAIKYTSAGGSVKVDAFAKEGFIEVCVSDTGIGIPEKDLPRIFERFYRVDKGRSRELGGTGLGLSIVKHIIHAHRGEVSVKSVLGQGSTFIFTVPQA